jgi:hypothetical protein
MKNCPSKHKGKNILIADGAGCLDLNLLSLSHNLAAPRSAVKSWSIREPARATECQRALKGITLSSPLTMLPLSPIGRSVNYPRLSLV